MDNYPKDKKLEYQRQAIDCLNRAISWCSQVGIEIKLMMTPGKKELMMLVSSQIVVSKDKLELREEIKNEP